MITKYFNFFNSLKINEAFSLEQANNKSEEFINRILSNRALSEKKIEAKKQAIKKLGLSNEDYLKLSEKQDLTEEEENKIKQIKEIINKTVLSEKDKSDIKNSVDSNPFLKRIRNILISVRHPEWVFGFIKLFYHEFPKFKINIENDRSKIENMLGPFTYINGEFIWNKNSETNQDDYAGFGVISNQLSNSSKITQTKVVNDLESNIFNDRQKEELNKPIDRQTGFDMVETTIKNMELDKNTNGFLSKLPTGIKNEEGDYIAPNLLKQFNDLPDTNELKKEIIKKTKDLVGLLMKDYSFEPYKKPLEKNNKPVKDKDGKQVYVTYYPCENIFSPRMGTSSDPQKFKSLEEYLKSVNNNIESLSDVSKSRLFTQVGIANKMFGDDKGVEVVYNNNNEDNIVVLKIKSYLANNYLHDRTSGKLVQTRHCIAYGESHWRSIVEGNSYNRLYYVYNFNLKPSDNLFPFGLIVRPKINSVGNILTDDSGNMKAVVDSSYDKIDDNITSEVLDYIKKFGLDFDKIFLPATKEEIKYIELRKNASKILEKDNLTLEEAKECIEQYNADVNTDGGKPLINAVKRNYIDLVKYLLSKGANPKLGNSIMNANTLECVKLLGDNVIPADVYIKGDGDKIKDNNALLRQWLSKQPTQEVVDTVEYLLNKGCPATTGEPIKKCKKFDLVKLLCQAGATAQLENLIDFLDDVNNIKYLLNNGLSNNILNPDITDKSKTYLVWNKLFLLDINFDKFKEIFELCLKANVDILARNGRIFNYCVDAIKNSKTETEKQNELNKLKFILDKLKMSDDYTEIINRKHVWKSLFDNRLRLNDSEDIGESVINEIKEIINNWAGKDLFIGVDDDDDDE